MKTPLAQPDRSVVLLIDWQPSVLRLMPQPTALLGRAIFLADMARLLDVPILLTEQNPARLGSTDESLAHRVDPACRIEKSTFAATQCEAFMTIFAASGRDQAIVTGVEAHICVAQTVCGLLDAGVSAHVCLDAVSSRSPERTEIGIQQMIAAGARPTHTESVAYEWLGSHEHPAFREALKIVKAAG